MQTFETISNNYPITESEYKTLDKELGKLAHYAVWQLKRKNSKNSMTNDPEDDVQELRIALIRAGSYYKRQTYVESCLESLKSHVTDKFIQGMVTELENLWLNRRHHGANRQKFGQFQEDLLEKLVENYVPKDVRPNRYSPVKIDTKFTVYAKRIIWNAQKSLGKQITREKSWRTGLVSLSDYEYLGSEN